MVLKSPIVFMHLPKTAGTSFRLSAQQYFGPQRVLNDYGKDSSDTSDLIRKNMYEGGNVDQLKQMGDSHSFLTGHFSKNKYEDIFPNSPIVSFFREPVNRVLSAYVHYSSLKSFTGTLADYYREKRFQNLQFNALCGAAPTELDFYGLTEEYQTSLDMFNEKFGTYLRMSTLNKGKYKGETKSIGSPEEIAEIRELNRKDVEMYEYAVENFKKQEIRSGPSYKMEERFLGSVGRLNNGLITGWAIDRQSPNPAKLTVSVNDEYRFEIVADLFRPDVRDAGQHMDGHCGFRIPLARLGTLIRGDKITVRTQNMDYRLNNSPFVIEN